MVARSKNYHTMECAIDCGHRAPQIRRPEDERCELYEAGAWATRYAPPDRHPPEGDCEIKGYAETCRECGFCADTLESSPEV